MYVCVPGWVLAAYPDFFAGGPGLNPEEVGQYRMTCEPCEIILCGKVANDLLCQHLEHSLLKCT